jgi:hypothetical protein
LVSENLFVKILLEPASNCNQLNIISGYASPAMANKHLSELGDVSVNLIVGMTPSDGLGLGGHVGFQNLNKATSNFNCRYVFEPHKPVHIKSYIWLKDGVPQYAFTGSGNYSQNAFFGGTIESFAVDNPLDCNNLFNDIYLKTISCLDSGVEDKINFYKEIYNRRHIEPNIEEISAVEKPLVKALNNCVDLSLLSSRSGETHEQSGLNWGQRKGREPNQAYIPIPSVIAQSSFFPNRANHFTLITDDGKSFDCAVAQDGDKAIHTTKSNSILGRYFRQRVGVSLGDYVKTEHLLKYGRTNIKICKIDDETYYMDFSV